MQNINSILKEKARTSVFVAHRLRTIYDSDQILVLKDGRVAETGTHAELLEKRGIYAELWDGKSDPVLFPPRSSGVAFKHGGSPRLTHDHSPGSVAGAGGGSGCAGADGGGR